jgi:hypothetical protein
MSARAPKKKIEAGQVRPVRQAKSPSELQHLKNIYDAYQKSIYNKLPLSNFSALFAQSGRIASASTHMVAAPVAVVPNMTFVLHRETNHDA